jgi:hypothetical protein
MTDADKVIHLTELLGEVMHSLEMTKFQIDDNDEAQNVIRQADNYHQQMCDILYKEGRS